MWTGLATVNKETGTPGESVQAFGREPGEQGQKAAMKIYRGEAGASSDTLFHVNSHFLNCPETAYNNERLQCGEVLPAWWPTLLEHHDICCTDIQISS